MNAKQIIEAVESGRMPMSAADLADLREAGAQGEAEKLRAIDAVNAAAMAVESAPLLTAIDDPPARRPPRA